MKDNLKRFNYERLFSLFPRVHYFKTSIFKFAMRNPPHYIFCKWRYLDFWRYISQNLFVCLFVFFWNYGSVSESTIWISQAIFIIHLAGLMGFKLFKKTDSKSETRRRSFSFLRRRSCSREERRSENFLRPRRTGEGQSPEIRTSQEVASALRKIGDELNNSTLSLHTAATT